MFKIPFGWLPASWGLTGKTREIAEAEYNLSGEDLERKLIELKYEGNDRDIKFLELEYKYKKINEHDYSKKLATLKKEPWVKIMNTDYNPKEPLTGSIELDWNDYFIESLEDAGYVAPSEEQIVDIWLSELCKNIATEQFGGVGEFDQKSEEVLMKKKKWT